MSRMSVEYLLDRPGLAFLLWRVFEQLPLTTLAQLESLSKSWHHFFRREHIWKQILESRLAPQGSALAFKLRTRSHPYQRAIQAWEDDDLDLCSRLFRSICWRIHRGYRQEWRTSYCQVQKVPNVRIVRDLKLIDPHLIFAMGNQVHFLPYEHLSEGSGACVSSVGQHRREVNCFDITDELLVTAGRDRRMSLWRLKPSGSPQAEAPDCSVPDAHQRLITSVKFIDSSWLASASRDKAIHLWQIERTQPKYRLVRHQVLQAHNHSVWDIDVTADYLVSGSADKLLRCWRRQDSQWVEHHAFAGHLTGVRNVKIFKSTPRYFVSGDLYGEVKVWDMERKCLQYEVPEIESEGWFRHSGSVVSFSETPGILATLFGNVRIGLYDTAKVESQLELFRIINITQIIPQGFVRCLFMTQFELFLATVSGNDDITSMDLWDQTKCSELDQSSNSWQMNT